MIEISKLKYRLWTKVVALYWRLFCFLKTFADNQTYFCIFLLTLINRHMHQIAGFFEIYRRACWNLLTDGYWYLFFSIFYSAKSTFLKCYQFFLPPFNNVMMISFTSLTMLYRYLTHMFPLINSVKDGNAENMNNFTSLLIALTFLMYLR